MRCIFCSSFLNYVAPNLKVKFSCPNCPNNVILFYNQPGAKLKSIQFKVDQYYIEYLYADKAVYIFDSDSKYIQPISILQDVSILTPFTIKPWLNRILNLKAFI